MMTNNIAISHPKRRYGLVLPLRSRAPSGEMRARIPSISMRTYKPHLITERRRRVEDLCRFSLRASTLCDLDGRDLVVNNDHIHVMEMRLRAALAKVSL